MGYLENFARNRRTKEKTEVLTARLPEGLYCDFRSYCDELGISISEAVYLLVQREMDSIERVVNTVPTTDEYTKNDDVVTTNTTVVKPKPRRTGTTTTRFTTKQWQVNGELPCPKCNTWVSAANYSRHAKQHGSNTYDIFTNESYLVKINDMIKNR